MKKLATPSSRRGATSPPYKQSDEAIEQVFMVCLRRTYRRRHMSELREPEIDPVEERTLY